MQKILIGVDGSGHSEKALKVAIEVAKRFSAKMTVINVYSPPTGPDVNQKILDRSKAILESEEFKLFNLVSFLSPNAAKAIMDMAEKEKFDLIVVGSRGAGAITSHLIGSVSSKICHDSKVSVLLVK